MEEHQMKLQFNIFSKRLTKTEKEILASKINYGIHTYGSFFVFESIGLKLSVSLGLDKNKEPVYLIHEV
jgi:hypothetical protein